MRPVEPLVCNRRNSLRRARLTARPAVAAAYRAHGLHSGRARTGPGRPTRAGRDGCPARAGRGSARGSPRSSDASAAPRRWLAHAAPLPRPPRRAGARSCPLRERPRVRSSPVTGVVIACSPLPRLPSPRDSMWAAPLRRSLASVEQRVAHGSRARSTRTAGAVLRQTRPAGGICGPAAGRTSTGMPVRCAMPETRSSRSGPSAASRLTFTPRGLARDRQAGGVLMAPAVRQRDGAGHEVGEQPHRHAHRRGRRTSRRRGRRRAGRCARRRRDARRDSSCRVRRRRTPRSLCVHELWVFTARLVMSLSRAGVAPARARSRRRASRACASSARRREVDAARPSVTTRLPRKSSAAMRGPRRAVRMARAAA